MIAPAFDLPSCSSCGRPSLIGDSDPPPLAPGHLRCAAGCGWEGARPGVEVEQVEQARQADRCWEQVTMALGGAPA